MKSELLTQYNQCPYKKEETKTEGEYHLMTEVEIGVDSAAKQEMSRMDGHLQKLGRSKERFCPTGFRGSLALLFGNLGSRTVRQ